jgi:hypothetical protein
VPCDQEPEERGRAPIFLVPKWVFNFIIGFLCNFKPVIMDVLPCFEVMKPILRSDLGRKLRCDP